MEKYFRDEWVEKWFEFIQPIIKSSPHVTDEYYLNPLKCVSSNANIDMEFIAKHPEFEWDWKCVSANPNLPFDFVLQHPEYCWNWYCLSMHKNVNLQKILDNPTKPWKISHVVANPNITIEMLQTHEYFMERVGLWVLTDVMQNPSIPFEKILAIKSNKQYVPYLFSLISGEVLSCAVNLDIDYVFANLNIQWNLSGLFENPKIGKYLTDDHLAKLVEHNFTYNGICNCEMFRTTLKSLYEIPNSQWLDCNAYLLSCNEYLLMKFVTANKNLCWDEVELCSNELKHDRETYIANKITSTLLATMHEQRSTTFHATEFEQIVADEYVVMHLCKY
jgi:hypothetical protein